MFGSLVVALSASQAFLPGGQPLALAPGRASVQMSTKYGDPSVASYRKKNPKTGSSDVLKGYTVGSRAPPAAVASGSKAQFGYGIDNLYGGRGKVAEAKSAGQPKGVIEADAGGALGKIGTVWAGLLTLYLLSLAGGGN